MTVTGQAASELRRALLQADPGLSRFRPLPRIISYDDFSTSGMAGMLNTIEAQGKAQDALEIGALQHDQAPQPMSY